MLIKKLILSIFAISACAFSLQANDTEIEEDTIIIEDVVDL